MERLKFTFTPEQNIELTAQATAIADHLRMAVSPPLINPRHNGDLFDLATRASTTALHETLGKDHPLFQQRMPDSIEMHNCPTHVIPSNLPRDVFPEDLFMTLAVAGLYGKIAMHFSHGSTVPGWHQDLALRPKMDPVITLFCKEPGTRDVPTSVLSMEAFLRIGERRDLSGLELSVSTAEDGKQLLHVPKMFVPQALRQDIQDESPANIHYTKNTMFAWRDERNIHCTGLPLDENGLPPFIPQGRKMLRNELHERDVFDYRANPADSLNALHSAAKSQQRALFL